MHLTKEIPIIKMVRNKAINILKKYKHEIRVNFFKKLQTKNNMSA